MICNALKNSRAAEFNRSENPEGPRGGRCYPALPHIAVMSLSVPTLMLDSPSHQILQA